jgi:hypothetical protein
MNMDSIIGVWEVHASDAPFPWHMMSFFADGIVIQTNPPAGNQSHSDSNGHGLWRATKTPEGGLKISGKFVEFKADIKTGRFIGKGVIKFNFIVNKNRFKGTYVAYTYNNNGTLTNKSPASALVGERVTLE